MITKYLKKLFSTVLCLSLLTLLCIPAFASEPDRSAGESITIVETIKPGIESGVESGIQRGVEPVTYGWKITRTTSMGTTFNGSSKLLVGDFTAARAGEKYSVAWEFSDYAKVTGTLKVTKSQLEGSIDIEFGSTYGYIATGHSDELEANELVTAYAQPEYEKTKVDQKQYKIDQAGRMTYTGQTATCYTYRPIAPRISFVYSK